MNIIIKPNKYTEAYFLRGATPELIESLLNAVPVSKNYNDDYKLSSTGKLKIEVCLSDPGIEVKESE